MIVGVPSRLEPAEAASDAEVADCVLSWLHGDLPTYPFDGFEEWELVDVPTDVLPPGRGDVLDRLFPPDNLLQIRVERKFTGDRVEGYRLCASGLVGISTVGDGMDLGSSATVTVRPKVPGSSLLTMLSYAFVPDLSSGHRPEIDVKNAPIVSLVLLMYLLRVRQLVECDGLQRAYIGLEERLRGTVRGRCALPTYLQRSIPTGRAHVVPCQFWELRVDSEPNRALRWGIEVCRALADWLQPRDLTDAIESRWRAIAPHFAGIPVVCYQPSQVRRLPRSGRFALYEPVLELLEFLLDRLSFDIVSGEIRVRGFAVEMWEVFEHFVVNLLASHMRGQVQGPRVNFGYDVVGAKTRLTAKNIYLDALIKAQHTVVVDAKWKEGIVSYAAGLEEDDGVLQIEGLQIRNADLFQVVAYGRHRAVQAQASLLVYPVLKAASVCRLRCILDFLDSAGEDRVFPVFLVGIPVGETLQECIGDFVETVQGIVAGSTVAQNGFEFAGQLRHG